MSKLSLPLVQLLYMRFATIFGTRFTSAHPTQEFIDMWWDDWAEGLAGINSNAIKAALVSCRMDCEWPPSLAEFRKLCEKDEGIPTVQDILQLCVRRDLTHPMAQYAYEKIGSWDLSHGTAKELTMRIKDIYQDALNAFRQTKLQLTLIPNEPTRMSICDQLNQMEPQSIQR